MNDDMTTKTASRKLLAHTAVLATALVAAFPAPITAKRPPSETTEAAPELRGGASSIPELIDRFLLALREKDRAALQGLRITEKEYRDIILPGSVEPGEPQHQMESDWATFLWGSLNVKSGYKERALLEGLGGKKLAVRDVSFARGERKYAGYKAYSRLDLKLAADDGGEETLELGSIAEVGGRLKFISYARE
jgi:hypothetical protein